MTSHWQEPLDEQPEFFPGSIIGYRQFEPQVSLGISMRETVPAVSLKSLYWPQVYPSGAWYDALCTVKASAPHDAPGDECRCGFYAAYLPHVRFDPTLQFEARAVVECAGKIKLCTKGFRAARMRILGLAVPGHMVEWFSRFYPRVVAKQDWDSLVDEFPRTDYESLLGKPVQELAFVQDFSAVMLNYGRQGGKSSFLKRTDLKNTVAKFESKNATDKMRIWVGNDASNDMIEIGDVSNFRIYFGTPPADTED